MEARIFSPTIGSFNDKLNELGLRAEWLTPISERALLAFNSATPHDPKSAAGVNSYNMAVRTLRDILCPKGWEPKTDNNLEITGNDSIGVSIIVSSGDKGTGNPNKTPKTKNGKGEQTKKVVFQNSMTPSLFPEFDAEHIKELEISSTWMLLYHIDMKAKQVRMELSLPMEIDFYDTRVTSWKERIILPALDFGSRPVIKPEEFVESYEPEIKRKSNDR